MFSLHHKPLSIKEELQLALNGIHAQSVKITDRQVLENRINVHNYWPATVMFIDQEHKKQSKKTA